MPLAAKHPSDVSRPQGATSLTTSAGSVVVQVTEGVEISPVLTEQIELHSAPVWIPETGSLEDMTADMLALKRSSTMEGPENTNSTNHHLQTKAPHLAKSLHRSSSFGYLYGQRRERDVNSKKRDHGMQLPSFKSLGICSSDPKYMTSATQRTRRYSPVSSHVIHGRPAAQSFPGRTQKAREPQLGSTPLLTPPEDADSIKWNNALLHHNASNTLQQNPYGSNLEDVQLADAMSLTERDQVSGSSTINTEQNPPMSVNTTNNMNFGAMGRGNSDESTLTKATRATVSSLRGQSPQLRNVQIVSQILPLPPSDTATTRPAVETVVENAQDQFANAVAPFITITHAVSQGFEMKDLPSSPPVTPNVQQLTDDYFGQSIFSSAAIVPNYHSHSGNLIHAGMPSPKVIVAPSSVQVSVLERYIPPTSAQEYKDLLSSNGPSMLVDRLAELSRDGGTLLLIYPTKTGAKTFTSSYLGPILEPFLRRFISLNDLVFDLASVLGTMTAVGELLEFESMEGRIKTLCTSLNHKIQQRNGNQSRYTLIYSGKAERIVDRATWKEWFLHQETPRFRSDLVTYHATGGRMPAGEGHYQITPGVLARQIVEGFNSSKEDAGGVPIELGVFVIKRTA